MEKENFGWVCPKCGQVWSPLVKKCNCSDATINDNKTTTTYWDPFEQKEKEWTGKPWWEENLGITPCRYPYYWNYVTCSQVGTDSSPK